MKLIIQIPCFNEAESLPIALAALPKRLDGIDTIEVLVIDDGSTDDTIRVAREHGVDYVVGFSKNQGLARAFMLGLRACLERGADIIVNTDADNQYVADDMQALVQPVIDGAADIVVGARPIRTIQHFSPIKKLLQRIGSFVVAAVSGTRVEDAPSGYRALSREAALHLNVFNDYTYTLETIIQAGQKNMSIVSVPVRVNDELRPSRLVRSIRSYVRRSILTIFRIFIIYRPFVFFMRIGVLVFLLGCVLAGRFMYYYLTDDRSGHVQSLIVAGALLMIGFQTVTLAFIADLLSVNRRLLEEIQQSQRSQASATAGDGSGRVGVREVYPRGRTARPPLPESQRTVVATSDQADEPPQGERRILVRRAAVSLVLSALAALPAACSSPGGRRPAPVAPLAPASASAGDAAPSSEPPEPSPPVATASAGVAVGECPPGDESAPKNASCGGGVAPFRAGACVFTFDASTLAPVLGSAATPAAAMAPAGWRLRRAISVGLSHLAFAEVTADLRQVVAVSDAECAFRVYDLATGALVAKHPLLGCEPFGRWSVALWSSVGGERLLFTSSAGTTLYDVASGAPIGELPTSAWRIDWSRSRRVGFAVQPDIDTQTATLDVLDATGDELAVIGKATCDERVDAVALSDDGAHLLMALYPSDRIQLVSLRERRARWSTAAPLYVAGVDLSPDGALAAWGGAELVVADTSDPARRSTSTAFGNNIHRVRFSADGRWVFTSSYDGKARLFPATVGAAALPLAREFPHLGTANVYALAFIGAAGGLVTSSGDKTLRVWGP